MNIIRSRAYARLGIVGNPSDGYNGKTLSLSLRNFRAKVVLYDWPQIEVLPSQEDHSRFGSPRDLVRDVELHGYYGGIRLVKATIKRFVEFCDEQGIELHDRCFSVRYESNIPRQVGLAGSSAIIVATLRALIEFYGVEIAEQVQPSLALSVETRELGLSAGLQDRVIQVYDGFVFMDFSPERMQMQSGLICGAYERIDPQQLPPLYFAWGTDHSEPTEVFHNNLRYRFNNGEADVVAAMHGFAKLAEDARKALINRDAEKFADCIDRNFDLRQSICRLPRNQVAMVEAARSVGATAKFAGSGGAIVGTYRDDAMLRSLTVNLASIGCRVANPVAV